MHTTEEKAQQITQAGDLYVSEVNKDRENYKLELHCTKRQFR